jgi:hypothetical protein
LKIGQSFRTENLYTNCGSKITNEVGKEIAVYNPQPKKEEL